MADNKSLQIDAAPTKAFFVDMLVRDIPLETAILDLVDNSVDGAKRFGTASKHFDGKRVEIELSKEKFRIFDNCGGFDQEAARLYAFRFGRAAKAPRTPHSIGQFGVGMKRALFKFGRHFIVQSATDKDAWAIDVDVNKWETEADWHFPWATFKSSDISRNNPGTEIVVDQLRPEVSAKFGSEKFSDGIAGLIKSKHRQFIAKGLSISVNGAHIDATDLNLLIGDDGGLKPGVDNLTVSAGGAKVDIRIVVGLGASLPREAGWYVICNGRIILEGDRRSVTGWGLLEEEAGRAILPSYHNQFARFRGIVSFDSEDSARVPWNTTKTTLIKTAWSGSGPFNA
ncbi:MAG: ATP-binding protein [Pseudolabrys sp.]|nr:ATP-binding protein [Pseudolabrys sp.]